jgi:hypothetical protein
VLLLLEYLSGTNGGQWNCRVFSFLSPFKTQGR